MTITIDVDKRGLIVRTPYSAQFVSELKRLIPQSDRLFSKADGTHELIKLGSNIKLMLRA